MMQTFPQLYYDCAPYILVAVIIATTMYNGLGVARNERRIINLERKQDETRK